MAIHNKLHNLPVRLTAGLYLLDSGLATLSADEAAAVSLHKFATDAYGLLSRFESRKFSKCFATGELLLAAGLLLPFVPDETVGLGLTVFSAIMFGLYLRLPGMRRERSLRSTPKGTSLAKNIWLLGMGLSLALTSYRSSTDEHPDA